MKKNHIEFSSHISEPLETQVLWVVFKIFLSVDEANSRWKKLFLRREVFGPGRPQPPARGGRRLKEFVTGVRGDKKMCFMH